VFQQFLSEQARYWLDASAIGAVVASLFGWLPEIAALLSVIWFGMRLYETHLAIRLKKHELRGKE
jgi:hypothetical protein